MTGVSERAEQSVEKEAVEALANALWTHDGYAVNQAITRYAECIAAYDAESDRLREGWTWQAVSERMAADILEAR